MEAILDLIKIIVPAGIVLYAVYLIVKAFLNREFDKKVIELRMKNTETVLPIRLQAYERMCLFLERITPTNLLVRLNQNEYSAREFQQILLNEIRNEYNHNLSQQVYMSDEAWELTRKAMEEIIVVINTAASELEGDGTGTDLSRKIFDLMITKQEDPTRPALKFMKREIREVF